MIKQDAKRVFVETYGCQMNEYDTELVKSILSDDGFSFVKQENDADVIMLNTCAIREHAESRVIGRLGELARYRRSNPQLRFAVIGCMISTGENSLVPIVSVGSANS